MQPDLGLLSPHDEVLSIEGTQPVRGLSFIVLLIVID